MIVGLKNEILFILAISFAFFGMRRDANEPKMVVSSRFVLSISLLSDELFLARFAILFTLPDRGRVSVMVPPVWVSLWARTALAWKNLMPH